MGVLFDVYILFAWLGTREEHKKIEGVKELMPVLLFVLLSACVVFSYVGGTISIIMTLLALASFGLTFFLAPIIALVAFIGYFCGLSDWLADNGVITAKGYLRCANEASWFQWLLLILWLYLRIDSLIFCLNALNKQ